MKITSVALPSDLTDRIDKVARHADRSRSWIIRDLLSRAMTGEQRLDALKQIAHAELEDQPMPTDDLSAKQRERETDVPGMRRHTVRPADPTPPAAARSVTDLTAKGVEHVPPAGSAKPLKGAR